jgi:acetyl esterase/lipase
MIKLCFKPKLSFLSSPIVGLGLALLLSGCSSLDVLNAVTPNGEAQLTSDIRYGEQLRQTLDIHLPTTTKTARPVVIFFYGGRWQNGSKSEYVFVGQALAKLGIITVIPDYRLFPDVEFPTFIRDSAAATKWTLNNIQRYGGDPKQVFLMGHSAGAHIAAMLATNAQYLQEVGLTPRQLKGMIGLAGGYDFKITDADIKQVFRRASSYEDSQPINFVDGDEPPLLLLHGKKDVTLAPQNSKNLAYQTKQLGGQAEVVIYDKMAHVGMLLSLVDSPFMYFSPVLKDIEKFVYCGSTTVNNCTPKHP